VHCAGNANTDSRNVFVGCFAGNVNSSGSYNVFVGDNSGSKNTTGGQNVFIGRNSGFYNRTGSKNVLIGWSDINAFPWQTDPGNLGHDNTLIGYSNSFRVTGNYNTAMGSEAGLYLSTGNYNSFLGRSAGRANNDGESNSAFGSYALVANSSGDYNCAFGESALNQTTASYNTAIGGEAMVNNSTGTFNTAVGYTAFYNGTNYTNSTALGYNAPMNGSNAVSLGNTAVIWIGGQVGWSVYSDGRFKQNVSENIPGLSFINQLRPVSYNYDTDAISKFLQTPDNLRLLDAERQKSQIRYSGFVAQEVEAVAKKRGYDFSGVCKPQNENDVYSLRYAEFTVPLVKAVQELSSELETQKKLNEEQKNQIDKLLENQKEVEGLRAELEAIKTLLTK